MPISDDPMSFLDVRNFLSDPRAFQDIERNEIHEASVSWRETHISLVFLTEKYAYKLRKPVRWDFVDFSTREARYWDCWQEVLLNRRLAPGVYLKVIPLVETVDGLALGGIGRPVDWLVQMRRLPDEQTLEACIDAGNADFRTMDRILDVLCPFFESAPTDAVVQQVGDVAAIRRNVRENFDVLSEPCDSEADGMADDERSNLIARLRSAQLQFLALREAEFRQRQTDGWIRDGHGDLRAEHIYLEEPPVIIDCIEFNSRFRHIDILDEVCFLATDLDRLGRSDLADYALQEYRKRLDDPATEDLVGFFKSYRHMVRGKVACLRAAEQTGDQRKASMLMVESHLQTGWRAIRPFHQPCLIVCGGLSGSGKSTIAAHLAERLGCWHVSSDRVRKELFGLSPLERSSDPQLYSRDANQQTYAELLRRGRAALSDGISVILDATFLHRSARELVLEYAERTKLPFLFVHCRAPDAVIRERISRRQAENRDPSDADLTVYEEQCRHQEAWDELPEMRILTLDTQLPPEEMAALIVSRLSVV